MVHFWGVSIIIDSTDYDSAVICTIYGVINIKICIEHYRLVHVCGKKFLFL